MTEARAAGAIVAGGGVTGLVAALELARAGIDVVLLEAQQHPGGKLRTTSWRGVQLDLGPDCFIVRNPAAEELCRDLGLSEQLVAPSSGQAAIFTGGRLRAFPAGLVLGVPTDLAALARSGIVSAAGVARCALDLVLWGPRRAQLAETARAGGEDPTIEQVIAPRLGHEVLAKLVDPLLGGINAGDSRQLSFAAAAPTLAARLGREPSLIRSLRPAPLASPAARSPAAGAHEPRPGAPPDGATGARPVFLGLEHGLATLAERLAQRCEALGVSLRQGARLERVQRDAEGRYLAEGTGFEPVRAPRLVLALPAEASAHVVAALSPELAGECSAIPTAGVALVTVAYAAAELAGRTPGNGVLLPRRGGRSLTALTFVSAKWPRSAPDGEVLVRASLGHHSDEEVLALDDDALVTRALLEIGQVLGTGATPLEVLVQRWPASFPQYVSGHLARVARIESLLVRLPGLELAGAAYRGIGIPACIDDGRRAARSLTEMRGLPPA